MTGVVETRDVFSELPDDVLVHILSFLRTLDSVRTMLLRRFGDLWTLVPKLEFQSFYDHRKLQRFMIFVRHALLLHQAPVIHSFILKLNSNYRWDREKDVVDEILTWIKCALCKDPKLVSLEIFGVSYFPLPHSFFPNQSLVDLTLQGCRLKQRRHKRVHMGSLRNLTLSGVGMDESEEKGIEIFNEIISGCPSLEVLNLSSCNVYDIVIHSKVLQELVLQYEGSYFSINLSCPNVKILHLSCSRFPCYKLLDISSVCEATVQYGRRRIELDEPYEDIQLLLKSLQNVEVLTLDSLLLKDKIFPQNRWKVVTVKEPLSNEPFMLWIRDLVRKSPNLEELTVEIEDGCEFEWISEEICPQLAPPCVAPHLREVRIIGGYDYDDLIVLELVEFFLNSAVVLVELEIVRNYIWQERLTKRQIKRKMNKLSKKISRFTIASSNARITIYQN